MYILIPVAVLGVIGLVAALILFFCSKKFAVKEDPRLGQVGEVLPQANCGGCGYPGCSGFAAACVKAAEKGSLEGLNCPTGGAAVMGQVSEILGLNAVVSDPKVAVVRCNGSCENRPRTVAYDGMKTCKAMNACGAGETGCQFGCLGCGDCVVACQFDAIHINKETGLPEVDGDKCVACGACVKACPRMIIELRKKGKGKGMRLWVQCVNKEKGAVAKKSCAAACIACGMCEKVCQFDAVHVVNNVAYIDPEKCKMCRKCESVCPQNAIHSNGFPKPVEKKKLADLLPKPKPTETAGAEKTEGVGLALNKEVKSKIELEKTVQKEEPKAEKSKAKIDYSVTEDPILRKIRMENTQQS